MGGFAARVRPFTFDRSWTFPVAPDALWDVLTRTDDYTTWWRWLREFDAGELTEGTAARCVVRGPFPYSLNFTVNVVEIETSRSVRTEVSGDLAGPARLEIEPDGDGSTARLAWEVELCSPMLRELARWARPLMEWGHGWVVDNGVRQFRRVHAYR
jgi:hypothetical protein